jgi:hypothetical protein
MALRFDCVARENAGVLDFKLAMTGVDALAARDTGRSSILFTEKIKIAVELSRTFVDTQGEHMRPPAALECLTPGATGVRFLGAAPRNRRA